MWHHYFTHLESAKLRQLHKIITLKKSIFINDSHKNVYKICVFIKFINKREHNVSDWKTSILILIFINICKSLSSFLNSELYFLEIVDNYFRKTWCISLKQWFNASDALWKWKLSVKLHNDVKLLSVHSDNVMKLKVILNDWCSSNDIASQYTVSHMLIQNEVVERIIYITENLMQIMIKNAELFIKFWAKVAKTNVYLQNWIIMRFLINKALMISKKIFIEIKLSIDYVQVWRCKCYSYIDLKSLSIKDKRDKFMNRNRFNIFMKYVKNINKQYHFWVSDLNWVIKNHIIKFAEDEKNENMNLQLCKQTFNILSKQRSVRKSSKNNVSINILKSDAFMIDVSSESTDALKIIAINLNALNSKITSHTSDEHEAHANIQITQKVFALSMFKSAA